MIPSLPTPAERFQEFQAHHGPLSGNLAERILGSFFDKAVQQFFDYPASRYGKSMADMVAENIGRHSADILAILELASDWSADPMKAAERHLRFDLAAMARAEEEDRKRKEEAALKSAIKAKADAFMATLTAGGGDTSSPAVLTPATNGNFASPGDRKAASTVDRKPAPTVDATAATKKS